MTPKIISKSQTLRNDASSSHSIFWLLESFPLIKLTSVCIYDSLTNYPTLQSHSEQAQSLFPMTALCVFEDSSYTELSPLISWLDNFSSFCLSSDEIILQ